LLLTGCILLELRSWNGRWSVAAVDVGVKSAAVMPGKFFIIPFRGCKGVVGRVVAISEKASHEATEGGGIDCDPLRIRFFLTGCAVVGETWGVNISATRVCASWIAATGVVAGERHCADVAVRPLPPLWTRRWPAIPNSPEAVETPPLKVDAAPEPYTGMRRLLTVSVLGVNGGTGTFSAKGAFSSGTRKSSCAIL
jgi:hypothetical protein